MFDQKHGPVCQWFPISVIALVVLSGSANPEKTIDQIAAVVGEDIILLSEVLERAQIPLSEVDRAEAQGSSMTNPSAQRDSIVSDTLQIVIDDVLIRQQAKEMKVRVNTEEVDMAIANMARENGVDLGVFVQAIEARGKSMSAYKSEVRRELLKYKIINLRVRTRVKINDDEARQFYNDQVRGVRATGWYEGSHILIRVPEGAKAVEVSRLRKEAQEIRDRLQVGDRFSDLAVKRSQDQASARRGGKLGRRTEGELPPQLERSFMDLEPGEATGPLRTSAGFHVLRLDDREDLGVQSFAEVKSKIFNQLMQEEMVRQQRIWLKELRLRTFVDIRI